MQLKKIRVYGKLRQFLGKSYFIAAVKSPQQAMSFLIANFEGVQKHMNDQIYKIKMGGRVVTEEYLSMSGQGDIQIIPIATGSLPVVVGALLTVGGSAVGATVLGSTLLATVLSTALTTIGTSMLIGGITDFLAPQESIPESNIDPTMRGSFSFSGIQNTSSSGVPIPIIYGYVYSGSILISSGVDTAQLVGIINDTGTYSQENEIITLFISNHGFENGDALEVEFTSGPLLNFGFNPLLMYVSNKTTDSFQTNLGNMPSTNPFYLTYANSLSNVVKLLNRIQI